MKLTLKYAMILSYDKMGVLWFIHMSKYHKVYLNKKEAEKDFKKQIKKS